LLISIRGDFLKRITRQTETVPSVPAIAELHPSSLFHVGRLLANTFGVERSRIFFGTSPRRFRRNIRRKVTANRRQAGCYRFRCWSGRESAWPISSRDLGHGRNAGASAQIDATLAAFLVVVSAAF